MSNDEYNQKADFLKSEITKFKNKYGKRFKWAISLKRNKYIIDLLDEIFPMLTDKKYLTRTKIYWLLHDFKDFPRCPVCGKPVEKNVTSSFKLIVHCSKKCACNDELTIQKIKQTSLERFGVPCAFQSQQCWDAIHKSVINKYGGTTGNIWETEYGKKRCKETRYLRNNGKYESEQTTQLRKNTIIERYGGTTGNIWETEYGKRSILETNLRKFGYKSPNQRPEARAHLSEILSSPEVQEKMRTTKRKNGTFNTSKPEDESYELLCEKFGKDDVIRQYKSEKYPFNCDFYVKSIDTYIECNFNWTHGGHPFDPNSEEDQAQLQAWKDKNTKFYQVAIDVWTRRDPNKMKTALDNNLRFKVFWTIDDVNDWIMHLNIQ